MPKIRRPPDSTSTEASSLASTSGFRNGSTITPLPSRTELVRPARNATVVTGSRIGSPGSIGDGGRLGSAPPGCSDTQTHSPPNPSPSSPPQSPPPPAVYRPPLPHHTPTLTLPPR